MNKDGTHNHWVSSDNTRNSQRSRSIVFQIELLVEIFRRELGFFGSGIEFAKISITPSIHKGGSGLTRSIVLSGLFHYLNNEVMYLALSNVHPVTLAVGNTMKRVFIMVASVMVFRNQISLQAGIGSAVGISGVLLYSLTKQHYESLEAAGTKKKKRSSASSKRKR